ncbi:MAG TPA: MBL fold metallo-hydrolase [Blastocatellia bacterium]|nr:MBL fold metallo-hydrolase [Blastocatellia bacterium]
MKLTILGSGTIVPDGSRNSSGYFVELPDARIMLDCGAGTLHALARYQLPWEQMTHLFVSHFHADHIGELASLLFAFSYGTKTTRSKPFTIIGPHGLQGVLDALETAFGGKLLKTKFPLNMRMLGPDEALQLGNESELSVCKTLHTAESLAVRIDANNHSLCYTGDTAYSEALVDFFNGADALISECSFREPRDYVRHLSVSEAARLAARANVSTLILTHFYFDVDEEHLEAEVQKEYSGNIIVGRDGYSLELK